MARPTRRTTNSRKKAALGFRVHSGWAVMVAVAAGSRPPAVIDRRRIVFFDPSIPGSKQPFHAAEGRPLAQAEEYLSRCANRTRQMVRTAIRAAVEEIRREGYVAACSGLLTASGRPLTTLAATLASHALIHTAEGEFFRDAVVHGCEHCGVPVTRTKERELFALAETRLRIPANKLRDLIAGMGRPLGPPWSQDEKLAALVGWLALAGGTRAAPQKQA